MPQIKNFKDPERQKRWKDNKCSAFRYDWANHKRIYCPNDRLENSQFCATCKAKEKWTWELHRLAGKTKPRYIRTFREALGKFPVPADRALNAVKALSKPRWQQIAHEVATEPWSPNHKDNLFMLAVRTAAFDRLYIHPDVMQWMRVGRGSPRMKVTLQEIIFNMTELYGFCDYEGYPDFYPDHLKF